MDTTTPNDESVVATPEVWPCAEACAANCNAAVVVTTMVRLPPTTTGEDTACIPSRAVAGTGVTHSALCVAGAPAPGDTANAAAYAVRPGVVVGDETRALVLRPSDVDVSPHETTSPEWAPVTYKCPPVWYRRGSIGAGGCACSSATTRRDTHARSYGPTPAVSGSVV